MIRANAGGIVALMANVQFGGEWPVMKLPRKTMGADYLAIPAPYVNDTIAAERLCASPQPAITRLVYVLPKAVNERCNLVLHIPMITHLTVMGKESA
jgi:hypothetical protein